MIAPVIKKLIRRKTQRTVRIGAWMVMMGVWIAASSGLPLLGRLLIPVVPSVLLLWHFRGNRIPVLTYHSVSNDAKWLDAPGLIVPVPSFERQMKWIADHHYRTLSMDELYTARTRGRIPGKSIVLTFDDGYLDNWVAVEPILDKYRLKGTVFVSTQWIDPGSEPRPNINSSAEKFYWQGYLNRWEIKTLKKRGILDVQSHGVSHDRIFTSPERTGFVSETNAPVWAWLCIHPEDKPFWYKKKYALPKGYPLFKGGEALAARRFFPDAAYIDRCIDRGKPPEPDAPVTGKGRCETDEEACDRWRQELTLSRKTLEEITHGQVRHLCWPRSAYCKDSLALAKKEGYLSVTAGRHHNGQEDPFSVSRVHIGAIGNVNLDLLRFILEIRVFNGHYYAFPLLWLCQRIMARTWEKRQINKQDIFHGKD